MIRLTKQSDIIGKTITKVTPSYDSNELIIYFSDDTYIEYSIVFGYYDEISIDIERGSRYC